MPLITQGLRPHLKAACSKEAAIVLKRNQEFFAGEIRKNDPRLLKTGTL